MKEALSKRNIGNTYSLGLTRSEQTRIKMSDAQKARRIREKQ